MKNKKKKVDKRRKSFLSYEEAKQATQVLKIRIYKQYLKSYKKTPGLPCCPPDVYKNKGWINWFHFLGKPLPTYKEAKQVVQKLGIKAAWRYERDYKQDPSLPARPPRSYKDKGWVSWYDFFGTKPPRVFYTRYEEARLATLRLGLKTILEYLKCYKQDPKLPSDPGRVYRNKGWVSWVSFLGK